jgi:serine/threonine-protein kinase
VGIAAIEALGLVGGPLAIRPLKYTLRSPDWRLRAKSATALGQIGDPSINPVIADSLEDDNWWVRRNSAAALTALPGGTDLLLGIIESGTSFAADAAAEALADSGALAEARHRVELDEASDADQALIRYVSAQEVVSA